MLRHYHQGDCLTALQQLPDACVDSIVTDPPYELGFMGKAWDKSGIAYHVELWREALRVLKPGGHLLAFGGSRTYHRLACAIEDAGFEVRDQIMWLYGSGFPKSLDVSKAIDKRGGNAALTDEVAAAIKAARDSRGMTAGECDRLFCGGSTNWSWFEGRKGVARMPTDETFAAIAAAWPELNQYAEAVAQANREVIGTGRSAIANPDDHDRHTVGGSKAVEFDITAPATDAARQWQGWGTALKPAHEPICVARKPLIGTVAQNVLTHGTGAINIDGCRIPSGDDYTELRVTQGGNRSMQFGMARREFEPAPGRWPANLVHDGSDEVLDAFPQAPGQLADASSSSTRKTQNVYGQMRCGRGDEPSGDSENEGAVGFKRRPGARRLDTGSAARFFYCAKASKADRGEGNIHPTVKPTALMQYLVRLVTPRGGWTLDPFMGSGSTGKAAMLEAVNFIGVELDPTYFEIARARIDAHSLI